MSIEIKSPTYTPEEEEIRFIYGHPGMAEEAIIHPTYRRPHWMQGLHHGTRHQVLDVGLERSPVELTGDELMRLEWL